MEMRTLTSKEIQTATLLANGMRRVDVAHEMGISINTVKARIDNLLFKTFSTNTVQMVHTLTKQGLLTLVVAVALSGHGVDKNRIRIPRRSNGRPAASYTVRT
ncbi:MAG: LuxR C-terminal-related transcriptional regulator [Gammaproteobacteria bacterium]